jgi:hypothetical protein
VDEGAGAAWEGTERDMRAYAKLKMKSDRWRSDSLQWRGSVDERKVDLDCIMPALNF